MSQRILILASGTGTNAKKIIDHFSTVDGAVVAGVLSNKESSGALSIAKQAGVDAIHVANSDIDRKGHLLSIARERGVDLIVLAGFLRKIPADLVDAYPNRILNIHPALLPKHGGKGMYGRYVHEAVIEAGEKESGITIHVVDNEYDRGEIVFQASCPVDKDETPESLAKKIQELEHVHYPRVIEELLASLRHANRDLH